VRLTLPAPTGHADRPRTQLDLVALAQVESVAFAQVESVAFAQVEAVAPAQAGLVAFRGRPMADSPGTSTS
jgi:hypothetical protein